MMQLLPLLVHWRYLPKLPTVPLVAQFALNSLARFRFAGTHTENGKTNSICSS
jgi:hypothetical protein